MCVVAYLFDVSTEKSLPVGRAYLQNYIHLHGL